MRHKIYLFVIAALCFQACDENDNMEMETPEIEIPETETPHELEGNWKLADFEGESCENQYLNANDFRNHYFSLHESDGFTLTISQDSFCSIGAYSIKRIEIIDGDTTVVGITNYTSGLGPFINSYKINEHYSIVSSNLINGSRNLFGMFFPFHYPDFSANLNDDKVSEYMIDDDKLIISSNGEDNIRALNEGEKLTYSFTTTWTRE